MVDQGQPGESRDGTGGGDHDTCFTFGDSGNRACLTSIQLARLLIMRGYVMDFKQGEKGGAADGDIDWVFPTPAGVLVPWITPYWPPEES